MQWLSIFPDPALLEQVKEVEQGLRKGRRLGNFGWGALLISVLQISVVLLNSTWAGGVVDLLSGQNPWLSLLFVTLLVMVIFSLRLINWYRFGLKESKISFRYTYSFADFTPVPCTHTANKLAGELRYDLLERLNKRIRRLSLLDDRPDANDSENKNDGAASNGRSETSTSHIHISGEYLIREDEENLWIIEVTPRIRIGDSDNPSILAHPVKYRIHSFANQDQQSEAQVTPQPSFSVGEEDYAKLRERVYFSIASLIYAQIRQDVQNKIELLPTRHFKAIAYLNEANDYAQSNTLDAYEEARKLYCKAMILFDPLRWEFFAELPKARLPRYMRLAWLVPRFWQPLRRKLPGQSAQLDKIEVLAAEAEVGYANMVLYRRALANLSGSRTNPDFEARPIAQEAMERLERLRADVPKRRDGLFSAYVTVAYAWRSLGDTELAKSFLQRACSLWPSRATEDAYYLYISAELETTLRLALPFYRQAAELNPDFEVSQFSLASTAEYLWRTRPSLERSVAVMILREYDRVLELNPGNLGAWANQGYMHWLFGCEYDLTKALEDFKSGREYKEIKSTTFVADLDFGLARVMAERSNFAQAYEYFTGALSAFVSQGSYYKIDEGGSSYYFNYINDEILKRFDRYKLHVYDSWHRLQGKGDLGSYFDEAKRNLTIDDKRECAVKGLADLLYWVSHRLTEIDKTSIASWLEDCDLEAFSVRLAAVSSDEVKQLCQLMEDEPLVKMVRTYLPDAATGRVRDMVYAYVLNDYGEAYKSHYFQSKNDRSLKEATEAFEKATELSPAYVMPRYNLSIMYNESEDLDQAINNLLSIGTSEPYWMSNLSSRIAKLHQMAQQNTKRAEKAQYNLDTAQKELDKATQELDQLTKKNVELHQLAQQNTKRAEDAQDNLDTAQQKLDQVTAKSGNDRLTQLREEIEKSKGEVELQGREHAKYASFTSQLTSSAKELFKRSELQIPSWLWALDKRTGEKRPNWAELHGNKLVYELKWERELDLEQAKTIYFSVRADAPELVFQRLTFLALIQNHYSLSDPELRYEYRNLLRACGTTITEHLDTVKSSSRSQVFADELRQAHQTETMTEAGHLPSASEQRDGIGREIRGVMARAATRIFHWKVPDPNGSKSVLIVGKSPDGREMTLDLTKARDLLALLDGRRVSPDRPGVSEKLRVVPSHPPEKNSDLLRTYRDLADKCQTNANECEKSINATIKNWQISYPMAYWPLTWNEYLTDDERKACFKLAAQLPISLSNSVCLWLGDLLLDDKDWHPKDDKDWHPKDEAWHLYQSAVKTKEPELLVAVADSLTKLAQKWDRRSTTSLQEILATSLKAYRRAVKTEDPSLWLRVAENLTILAQDLAEKPANYRQEILETSLEIFQRAGESKDPDLWLKVAENVIALAQGWNGRPKSYREVILATSLEIYQQARLVDAKQQDPARFAVRFRCELFRRIGRVCFALGQHEEAIKVYKAIGDGTGDADEQCKTMLIDDKAAAQVRWSDDYQAILVLTRKRHSTVAFGFDDDQQPSTFGQPPTVLPIILQIATDLVAPEFSQGSHPLLSNYIPSCRTAIRTDTGILIPGVRVREKSDLLPSSYQISLHEIPLEISATRRNGCFTLDTKDRLREVGLTDDLTPGRLTGMDGYWLTEADKHAAEIAGLTLLDGYQFMVRDLESKLRQHLGMFVGIQEVTNLLEEWCKLELPSSLVDYAKALQTDNRALIHTTRLLRALVDEQVPLTPPERILAALQQAEDNFLLLRQLLKNQLPGNQYASGWRHVRLSAEMEALLAPPQWQPSKSGGVLAPESDVLSKMIGVLRTQFAESLANRTLALVVARTDSRSYIRYLTRAELPQVPVLARDELIRELDLDYDNFPQIEL